MARRTWILAIMIALTAMHNGAYAAEQNDATQPVDTALQNTHYEHPNMDMPFISINTDTALDLNWTAALEFSDPALRPTPVTLPFLTDYPFDKLEIKLRVLKLKF